MKTVVVGASTNPSRYAYLATEMLKDYKQEVVLVGIKKGSVHGLEILPIDKLPSINDVDTITLYIGARHQPAYYNYLISLKPRRVIFNPGTENSEFEKLLEESGIEALHACTLVLLRTEQY